MPTAARPLVQPGLFHRLGIVVKSGDDAATWFERTLGSFTITGSRTSDQGPGVVDADGARRSIMWLGSVPLLLLEPADPTGPVGRFFERQGPGVHSLAWEIEDMWTTENRLRRSGIGITGTNIRERHFFMHPRDTHGLLVEWTDTAIPGDPRTGAPPPPVPEPHVEISAVAWVTSVVRDLDAAGAFLQDLAAASIVEGNPVGPPEVEATLDLAIGDIVVRLVTPRSSASRHARFLDEVGPGLCAIALRVPDLDDATGQLERAGIPVAWREPTRAGTDPDATLGLHLEWTERVH